MQIANAISDADGDGRTGVTLCGLSAIYRMTGSKLKFTEQNNDYYIQTGLFRYLALKRR